MLFRNGQYTSLCCMEVVSGLFHVGYNLPMYYFMLGIIANVLFHIV